MRGFHARQRLFNGIGERRGAPRIHVHVQGQVFRSSRDPALFGVKQLLEEMHALAVVVEQLERDPHRMLGVELAQIAHVHFYGVAGMPALLDVG